MCGISGFEFLVIVVAAIIVLGPDKLPELLRMAGKASAELRRWKGDLGDMTREIQRSIPVDDLRKNLSDDLSLDRARARVKETEAEIDELRARLKKQLSTEEAAQPEHVARPTPAAEVSDDVPTGPAPVDPLLAGTAPAERPVMGPQPRPMTEAGRGIRRPEAQPAAAPATTEPAEPAEPPLPAVRAAAGSVGHDAMPARPTPAPAPAPPDDEEPA